MRISQLESQNKHLIEQVDKLTELQTTAQQLGEENELLSKEKARLQAKIKQVMKEHSQELENIQNQQKIKETEIEQLKQQVIEFRSKHDLIQQENLNLKINQQELNNKCISKEKELEILKT